MLGGSADQVRPAPRQSRDERQLGLFQDSCAGGLLAKVRSRRIGHLAGAGRTFSRFAIAADGAGGTGLRF
jgi:hypothetical protein